MPTSGYSKTPLAKKLGIKQGYIIKLVNAPTHYWELFTDLPDNLHVQRSTTTKKNFIHYFAITAKDLHKNLAALKNELFDNGMIWVSWYKRSSGIKTDITEDVIRKIALAIGLVDIKVCAVDEQWSGLKLVIPVKDRKPKE
jgi:hypothetical protein